METFSIWHGLVLLLLIGPLVYFLPSIIAFRRKHRNRVAILVINIFLGFTGIGWVAALVWAVYRETESGVTSR